MNQALRGPKRRSAQGRLGRSKALVRAHGPVSETDQKRDNRNMVRRKHRSIRPPTAKNGEERIVAPTRQTVAKLRHDVIDRLHKEGRLRSEHLQAAREVRKLWEAFGRGMFPTAQDPAAIHQAHRKAEYMDPIGRLSLG